MTKENQTKTMTYFDNQSILICEQIKKILDSNFSESAKLHTIYNLTRSFRHL